MSWGEPGPNDGYYAHTPMPGWDEGYPPPPRRRGLWIALAAGLAALLVLIVGAGVLVWRSGVFSSGDRTDGGGAVPLTQRDSANVEEVGVRYSALGSALTAGSSGCQTQAPQAGESDRVLCDFSVGTLELVTYTDTASFDSYRSSLKATVEQAPYYNRTTTDQDSMYAEYADDSESDIAWNARSARQSGRIKGATDRVDSLRAWYDQRGVTVVTRPVVLDDLTKNPSVRAMIQPYYLEPNSSCDVRTIDEATESEQVRCRIGDYDAVVHLKNSRADIEQARKDLRDMGATNETTWSLNGTVQGTSMTFVDSDGNPAVYYDQPDTLVNVYVFGTKDKQTVDQVVAWWQSVAL